MAINNDINILISSIPENIKQNSNIDELFQKLEKVEDKEKLKVIDEINIELKKLLESHELSDQDKKKLEEIKRQIEQLKNDLENLKKQIWQLPEKDIKKIGAKILIISENIEENWFYWKDESWIWWFFRNILKWIERFITFGSSLDKISATFERFWYWKKENIEKVLKLIWDIKYKDLKNFYQNLRNDPELKIYLEKVEHNDNPLIPNFIEKYTDKIINWFKDFFREKKEFENEEQKKIASYVVLTLLINKDFFEKTEDNWVTRFVREKIGFWQTPKEKIDDMTIEDLLAKMFPHGLSDLLRDYALPVKGVKLLDLRNRS